MKMVVRVREVAEAGLAREQPRGRRRTTARVRPSGRPESCGPTGFGVAAVSSGPSTKQLAVPLLGYRHPSPHFASSTYAAGMPSSVRPVGDFAVGAFHAATSQTED